MSLETHTAEAALPASAVRIGASTQEAAPDWFALSGAPAFQRVLQQRPSAKSEHFAVHCLSTGQLSTGATRFPDGPVDDRPAKLGRPPAPRLGLVVPKRHARRAVTRNLVKRQVRASWDAWWRSAAVPHDRLLDTDWVVRLRGPIDRKVFVSGRSEALAAVLWAELQGLFAAAAKRAGLLVAGAAETAPTSGLQQGPP